MSKLRKYNSLIVSCYLFLSSCTPDFFYAKYETLEHRNWIYEDVKSFTFEIDNTISEYQFFNCVRYGIAYPYRNMYVQYILLHNTDTLEKSIADVQLMNSQTGQPLGKGGSGIFYLAFPLMKRRFNKTGRYKVVLRQYMRKDTLPYLYNIGLLIDRKNQ